MAHLITSHKGEPHVSSANFARYHAGTLGPGKYLLPVGKRMACTMQDSNTLRILSGAAVCTGYEWEVEGDFEEVTIENGVPGYKRIDLLTAHIETDPVERIAWKVYRGEETTGTPVVPGYIDGDLQEGDIVAEHAVCSVLIDGINPQEPKMLLQESHTIEGLYADLSKQIKDVRHSLSRTVQSMPGETVAVWSDLSGYIAIRVMRPEGGWRRVNLTKDGKALWTEGQE